MYPERKEACGGGGRAMGLVGDGRTNAIVVEYGRVASGEGEGGMSRLLLTLLGAFGLASISSWQESHKSPTKSLFDVGSRRISIFTVNTKEYHSDVLANITRIMRRT
ncbi:hypothetical protein Tco_1019395 [Tanacetum coccineum]|uniref:Uncharacterized protein n=1 Tax=Tanacetum coccineum TaxID=301880 RepID=A0ABQ5FXB1_9ASTR